MDVIWKKIRKVMKEFIKTMRMVMNELFGKKKESCE